MKKLLSMILTAAIAASMTACSGAAAGTATTIKPNEATTKENSATSDDSSKSTSTEGNSDTAHEASTTGNETVKIEYWYSWTDKIQENNINLTEKFNETVGKQKGIQVTAEYQGSYDDLHQKLQAAHVAGVTPAVTVMEIASVKTFAVNGVIRPLDDYIERSGVNMKDFFPGLMENSYVDEKCYGLPYLRSTPILYLNTTLLEKAGLDPKGPATYDELYEYCKTIKEKLNIPGLSMNSGTWFLEGFLMQHGTTVLNKEQTATNINSPQSKKMFAFFKELQDKGYARIVAGADGNKVKTDVMNQSTAMFFSSTADLTNNLAIAQENGYEINTTFMPKETQYGVPTGGCNLVMTEKITDQQKEAAWEFINWMTSTEQAAYSNKQTGYVATRASVADLPETIQLYAQIPQYKVALDQLQYAAGRPMNPGYAQGQVALIEAMDAIWVNNADIDSTLAATEEKVNRFLNE